MLTCQHHIQWVRQVAGGLHQCILCTQVVAKKDVYPKLEDLPEEFRRRWDAHEATRPPTEPALEASAVKAPPVKPAPIAATTAPHAATATPTTATEISTPTTSTTPPPEPPVTRGPAPPRIPAPSLPADPHPGA